MPRTLELDKINLDAYDIEPFVNSDYAGFVIKWDSNIGFGEYTIYKKVGANEWFADSEHMDNNSDKAFITELTRLFIDKLTIEH